MKKICALTALISAVTLVAGAGNLCTDGRAFAVPVKGGKAPVIDGRLDDWDLSGEEVCWNAEQYADEQYAAIAFMHDERDLYVSVRMGLYDHEYTNRNRPADRYWNGDCVQVRLCTDPEIPYPLPEAHGDGGRAYYKGARGDRIVAVNLWKNSDSGQDHLFITAGPDWNRVMKDRPDGSEVKIVTEGRYCTMEAKIPWSALGVPDGRRPFPVSGAMPAVVDVKWAPGTDGHYTSLVYSRDPGAFSFLNLGTWGKIVFSDKGGLAPKRTTLKEIAQKARSAASAPKKASNSFQVELPKKGKLSVNIVRDDGWVVRELIGGEVRDAGVETVYWDGRDSLGYPCETGREYKWKAYLHDGLDWEYFGTVGVTGEPPYETADGRGGWGSDHGPAVDAAADSTGRYFVWHVAESGRAVVKTDFDGKVVWRVSPFVAGGFCYFTCMAAENGKLWLVFEQGEENRSTRLVRLDAGSGGYELFPDGSGAVEFPASKGRLELPMRREFRYNSVGCAVRNGKVYVSDTLGGRIFVLDGFTGAVEKTLSAEKPRGLCMADDGLVAVQASGSVIKLRFDGGREVLVDRDLELPYGVALGASGELFVSDHGGSHQVKKFVRGADGYRLSAAFGGRGGRSHLGKIDTGKFLYPAGLAVDGKGVLLVPEMAPPKIVNLLNAKTGANLRRYYGYTSYAPTTFPDCDDPLEVYYSLAGPDCFARAALPASGGTGIPDACWDFEAVRSPFGAAVSTMNTPYVLKADNGRKYIVSDAGPGIDCGGYGSDYHGVYGTWARPVLRIDDGDVLTPVACVWNTGREGDAQRLWCDGDGDGAVDEGETSLLTGIGGETFRWALQNGSMYVDANGDLYLTSQNQRIVRVRNRKWTASGAPDWDMRNSETAIRDILPGAGVHSGWRFGFLGMRRDREGNSYAAINCNIAYVNKELGDYMHQGMGHTADMNAVFMTKYDPSGRIVWRTGRKAVGAAKPGEILHHWCYAGLINDEYSVAASEWACFTFYTKDGFYVDRIFDTPGLRPSGKRGPRGMGGEDFSGQVVYFPERDEVWAYNAGHVFRVLGFEKGRVKGEWRTEGKVKLTAVDPLDFPGRKKPLHNVDFRIDGGRAVFTAEVIDDTPLVNVAREIGAVFKGGDAVGFEIGPADAAARLEAIPERDGRRRYIGFNRILAARIGGKDRVIAFKPFTEGMKKPISYFTPAGGKSEFEFIGEVPGAEVEFEIDGEKGYRVKMSLPAEFLELDASGGYAFEAEALLSGQGPRGLGTVERCYLHSPVSSSTTMTDDVPTESRLYPKGWRR